MADCFGLAWFVLRIASRSLSTVVPSFGLFRNCPISSPSCLRAGDPLLHLIHSFEQLLRTSLYPSDATCTRLFILPSPPPIQMVCLCYNSEFLCQCCLLQIWVSFGELGWEYLPRRWPECGGQALCHTGVTRSCSGGPPRRHVPGACQRRCAGLWYGFLLDLQHSTAFCKDNTFQWQLSAWCLQWQVLDEWRVHSMQVDLWPWSSRSWLSVSVTLLAS